RAGKTALLPSSPSHWERGRARRRCGRWRRRNRRRSSSRQCARSYTHLTPAVPGRFPTTAVSGALELLGEAELSRHAPHLLGLLAEHEADPGAAPPGSPGAPDAVDVGLAVAGSVEVDDLGDLGDVDPAGGDVGGDQRAHFAALEAGKRSLALALALVAVHRDGLYFATAQSFDEAIGAPLSANEDQRAGALPLSEVVDQPVELGALGLDVDEAVLNVGLAFLGRRMGVAPGVAGVGRGERAG